MKKKILSFILFISMVVGLFPMIPLQVAAAEVVGITANNNAAILNVGSTDPLTSKANPSESEDKMVHFSTMNSSVAAVTSQVYSVNFAISAITDTIYAAAYMGAKTTSGTTLPTTIEIEGVSTAVTWNISDDSFAVPYDTVTISGSTADSQSVTASVEVIPPQSNPLIYFVDSGRGGDSHGYSSTTSAVYTVIKELSTNSLYNQVADQKYVNGSTTWGFDDSVQKVKTSPNGNNIDPTTETSKWVIGLRSATNDIVYKLDAPQPGTYTLSSGFYDWYGNRDRVIQPKIEYQDIGGDIKTIQLDQLNTKTTQFISSEFTIPGDIDTSSTLTLTYAYSSSEKPILSWFAIAEGGIKQMIEDARNTAASKVNILLDGNTIKADNINGLTFKGFGVLSGNSTSALLMDYKAVHPEKYKEMLQILFGGENPIMTHVKIEMGNDRNNSTGPDPATMRTADEEANVTRHPGFLLAADAKKTNPDLKVSILRWNLPAWASDNDKIYTWYKKTILAAYREYGYMVNYVNPHINEHSADLTWSKQYAERVRTDNEGFESETERKLYNSIEVVISDEVGIGTFGGSMVSDASLRDAVPIAAYHYNTDDDSAGNFKRLAEEFDMEVWNSEAQATFSNTSFRPNNNIQDPTVAGTGIGGVGSPLEMGNTIIKGFVNSRRTHFIYQPAIGSFYEGGQYSFKELLSARDPWSGWIHYDAGLVILQHFNWFANVGWENETNTAGIWRVVPQASSTGATGTNPVNGRNGIPNYMTLAAPDKSNFSTVITNDSEYEKIYKLQTLNMGYVDAPSLEIWETRAGDKGEAFNSNYMQFRGTVSADGTGIYTVSIKPYSIVTVTTLKNNGKEAFNTPLPVEGERTVLDTDETGAVQNTDDNILYADNFDYSNKNVAVIGGGGQITGAQSYIESFGGSKSVIPRYTHDRNGAFEAYLDEQTGNYVLRQQLDKALMGLGGTWNGGDPVTAIGDYRWTNYKASADVSFENNDSQGGANYAAIGARYQGGGSSHSITGTPYVLKYWFDGSWQLLVNNSAVANGNVVTGTGGVTINGFDDSYNAWHNIAIQVAGNKVTAYLDSQQLATYTDPNPKLSGRVDLASGYYNVRFDNLRVEKIDGYEPYYSEHLDNLEMYDLDSAPKQKLVYSGSWKHSNGEGMYIYQRSLSTSQAAGATLQYTFEGTGFDLLGSGNGSAKLEVTVDGQVIEQSANTMSTGNLYQTYTLRGLKYGQHTVQIKVLSGTLILDSVAVFSGQAKGMLDTAVLQKMVEEAQKVEKLSTFKESDWLIFTAARNAAQEAFENPVSYKLDQEGVEQLTTRLLYAQNIMTMGDIKEISPTHYAATYVGRLPNLPKTVQATNEDGSKTNVSVNWDLDSVNFDNAYKTVAVTGSFGILKTTCYVEVVPEDILYFVDINATSNKLGYDSPAYIAVAELVAQSGKSLLNNAPDQVYSTTNGWGHGATPAISYKGIEAGSYSKQSTTGMYAKDQVGATVTYTFDNLPAGEHTLTLGTYSWWASNVRNQKIYLKYDNKSEQVDTIVLDSSSFDIVKGYPFTMLAPGSLELKLVAETAQSPMLSFVGVATVKPTDKSALQAIYDTHKNKDNDNYTDTSWNNFQNALAEALSALGKGDATQIEVDHAIQDLEQAVGGLQKKGIPQKTATQMAGEITSIQAPVKDAAKLILPSVDAGFSIAIKSSSNANVIALDGTITPQSSDTSVVLVFEVTRQSDGNKALTGEITVMLTFTGENPIENADKSTLQAMYDAHKKKDNDNYTDTSWNNFQNALAKALSTLGKGDATQIEVDHANQALEQAVGGLQKKAIPQKTAAQMAAKITRIQAPVKDAAKLILPSVDAGFSIAIKSSNNTNVIALNGTITPQSSDTSVVLIFEVTRQSDGTKALTGEIIVTVPAKTSTDVSGNSSESSSSNTAPITQTVVQQQEELITKTSQLNQTEKAQFIEKVMDNIPYTASSLLKEIKSEKLDKEVKDLINKDLSILESLGINIDQELEIIKLDAGESKTFMDIEAKHWAADEISGLVAKGVVNGYPDGTFKPQEKITVSDTFVFLDRVLLSNNINHMNLARSTVEKYIIDQEDWAFYSKASIGSKLNEATLEKVAALGNKPLSREILAQILYEITNAKLDPAQSAVAFTDIQDSDYKDAINYCVETGLLKGMPNNVMEPNREITRAELMAVLSRLDNALVK